VLHRTISKTLKIFIEITYSFLRFTIDKMIRINPVMNIVKQDMISVEKYITASI